MTGTPAFSGNRVGRLAQRFQWYHPLESVNNAKHAHAYDNSGTQHSLTLYKAIKEGCARYRAGAVRYLTSSFFSVAVALVPSFAINNGFDDGTCPYF